ncbi:hypothetical protein EZV62_027722 [Acer yangbiense]|uniref:CCHC-type domain-containing protein n=1 Tax=Acer yangbiense TaxID=1000413 RepID=A0A5C7GUS8_9ROSI|nr:hypothetical protein EZV62_027722 [Acer yangbiense]
MCASLSIREKEGPVHKLHNGLKVGWAMKMALCLAGKIFSPDLVNRDAFRALIPRIWKLQEGVEIEVVTKPIRKRAIQGLKFDMVDFWVQISNLPLLCMTKEIAHFLGGIIGEVKEVDTSPTGYCLVKFLRVRVAVTITKPLQRFLRVDVLGDGEETVMPIQYERLPSFCFNCGLVGHIIRGCPSVGGRKTDSGLVGEICANKDGKFGKENSNSKLNSDDSLGRNSGDCFILGKKLSRKENDVVVINKGRSLAKVKGVMPKENYDGLDPKPIFVFRSSGEPNSNYRDGLNFLTGKVIDRGPSDNVLKPKNHVVLAAVDTSGTNRFDSDERGSVSMVSRAEERKENGNSSKRVGQWKKAARNSVLKRDELEVMCVVFWRIWYWRNQFVHSSPNACNEDIIAWATNYMEEFRKANLGVMCRPLLSAGQVSPMKWSKSTPDSFKINVDDAIWKDDHLDISNPMPKHQSRARFALQPAPNIYTILPPSSGVTL